MGTEPHLGDIVLTSFNFAPSGWALCNGQTLPISGNEALFSLLGTTYGGDGTTTFGLPNLQSRVPIHSSTALGQMGGTETVALTTAQVPNHKHTIAASKTRGDDDPAGKLYSASLARKYAPPGAAVKTADQAIAPQGKGESHDNMQPYLVINYLIATRGLFPSRS